MSRVLCFMKRESFVKRPIGVSPTAAEVDDRFLEPAPGSHRGHDCDCKCAEDYEEIAGPGDVGPMSSNYAKGKTVDGLMNEIRAVGDEPEGCVTSARGPCARTATAACRAPAE